MLLCVFYTVKPVVLVEIINNTLSGIKATYQPALPQAKVEKFIESKKSNTTSNLHLDIDRSGLETAQVLINTYKGPLILNITANSNPSVVQLSLRSRRSRFNPFAQQAAREEIPNFDIDAKLSGEYPIAQARFTSGRPWDEYKIQVIIDEKQLENSKVSIAYKQLEKPETLIVHPVSRPAPGQRLGPGHLRQVVRTEYEPSEGLVEEVNVPSAAPMYQGSFDEQGNPIL